MKLNFLFFPGSHNLAVSVVTLGELNSLAKQLNYGNKRKDRINSLLQGLFIVDIRLREVIDKYGDIDAYSQGKLNIETINFSSRNMGKNDLWIAATASAYDFELVTTDKDFSHLKDVYIKLKMINIDEYK